jgi:phosphoenolpyruvate-protein phosphotransferase
MIEKTRRSQRELRFTGHAISAGIGIGPIFQAVEPVLTVQHKKILASDIAAETARLEDAVALSRKQLTRLKHTLAGLPEQSQVEISPLIDAYLHMLGQSRLMRGVRSRISDRLVNAESAMIAESELQAEMILNLTGTDKVGRLRRADEVREIGRRVVRNLTRLPFRNFTDCPAGSILAAESLRPSDAALIQPAHFAGVITAEGGPDGHTAVMLRALGIPAILGATGILEAASPGTIAIIDGDTGQIVLDPTPASLLAARANLAARSRTQRSLSRLQRLPSETTDHVAVNLQANLELPFELPMIAESGAQGIGLMRSEFIFMNREKLPDEDIQTEIYRNIIEAMDGDPVTIRALDWGSDKDVEALNGYMPDTGEANPALGLRGIRLLLRNPELLETQLAAILRASAAGRVRIMLPMVGFQSEIIAAWKIYDRVWRRLKRRNVRLPETRPPLGIMIETPTAALAARHLAKHADFFSIGTNDLTMYTLAADRGLPMGSKLYDPLEPTILRLILETAAAAAAANIPVSICGELASRPEATPLLIGLGIRELSMHGHAIPRVKRAVRQVSLKQCTGFAMAALNAVDADEVRRIIRR